jgi:hypothetical protein
MHEIQKKKIKVKACSDQVAGATDLSLATNLIFARPFQPKISTSTQSYY